MCNTSTSKVVFLAVVIKIMSLPLIFSDVALPFMWTCHSLFLSHRYQQLFCFLRWKLPWVCIYCLASPLTYSWMYFLCCLTCSLPDLLSNGPTDIHDFSEYDLFIWSSNSNCVFKYRMVQALFTIWHTLVCF